MNGQQQESLKSVAGKLSQARLPSATRLMTSMYHPGMISLYAGLPNPDIFPFVEASFTLADGKTLKLKVRLVNTCRNSQ